MKLADVEDFYAIHFGWHGLKYFRDDWNGLIRGQWPLLLTWINFNSNMDK